MIRSLNTDWVLKQNEKAIEVPFSIPGDVHSVLLDNKLIEDPYYRDNEYAVDWVHQQAWSIERSFEFDELEFDAVEKGEHGAEAQGQGNRCILQLDQIDCIGAIFINNTLIASTASQFIRYSFDISQYLQSGTNHIRIDFDSASAVAKKQAADFPFELPYLSWNCRVPHTNMLRKTPCHAGWDWNICLMPIGVYGQVLLRVVKTHWIDDVRFEQSFQGNDVVLNVSASVVVNSSTTLNCELHVAGVTVNSIESLHPGKHELRWSMLIKSPERWWPVGSGAQTRYWFTLNAGDQSIEQQIGFRSVRIVQTPDDAGSGFTISVNDQALFMRGANWIPADALPQRIVPEAVRELLQSAVDANMNMLRVWGGGQYEPDWFYDLCDEMGILIWQDFMFSCNHYPAASPDWLKLVEQEATQQVRRLSSHPALALWCGDNELVGALKWWEVTRNNRDRYLANYSRLNHTLETCTQLQISDVGFWPSSPSVGYMDFGDGWKNDAAGDMHFWDVWHEAKPFSAYQDIHPRFCSEFGFQSFPSMPVIKTFTKESDRNVSSPVMDVHQRNVGGNARIVETLVRYFKFPDNFERMVFLSQCQQAMAIKTAVEYWRCLKPHCMGTLFWQLNDTWPVASWSSLEYAGGWKLLQYAARRFYQPVLVAMVPGHEKFGSESQLHLRAINDLSAEIELQIELTAHTAQGDALAQQSYIIKVAADAVHLADTFDKQASKDVAYYRFKWRILAPGVNSTIPQSVLREGCNEYWLKPYKDFDLPAPSIQASQSQLDGKTCITLRTDKPAYFVSLDLGGNRVFSDNGFTLLAGESKQVLVERVLENARVPIIDELDIQHL